MSDPKDRNFVMIPLDVDGAEIDLGDKGVIEVTLSDVTAGIVVIGTPKGATMEERVAVGKEIMRAQEDRDPSERRTFVIVDGELGSQWKFWRLVPKAKYDPTFDEEVP